MPNSNKNALLPLEKRVGRDFWEGCFKPLDQCMVYVDLNIFQAGVVNHPSKGPFWGYNEIQNPRLRYSLIDYENPLPLTGAVFGLKNAGLRPENAMSWPGPTRKRERKRGKTHVPSAGWPECVGICILKESLTLRLAISFFLENL